MPVAATTKTTSTARYRVVALATTLAMVTYLDRTVIGTLAPGIRRDLGLSPVEMGWIFTAFQLAYGLFEIPTGRWADRVGTRSVLARIVIWWSVMTMATAAAASYVTMLVVRFLFGAGEAVGGSHVGVVGGTMNSIGNLIAMLNPLMVAYSVS